MKKLFAIFFLVIFLGCEVPVSNKAKVNLVVEKQSPLQSHIKSITLPSDPLSLECFFVSVQGDGIDDTFVRSDLKYDVTPTCLGISQVSDVVSASTLSTTGIDITVDIGSSRTFKLFGMTGTNTSGCGSTNLSTIFASHLPYIYLLGSATVDITDDQTITLDRVYTTSSTDVADGCASPRNKDLSASLLYVSTGIKNTTTNVPTFNITQASTLPPGITNQSAGSMRLGTVGDIATDALFYDNLFTNNTNDTNPVNDVAALDVAFEIDDSELPHYNKVEIRASLGSAWSSTFNSGTNTCGGSALVDQSGTATTGYEMRVWKNSTAEWIASPNILTNTRLVESQTLIVEEPLTNLVVFQTGNGFTNTYFLHVGIISRAAEPTYSSPGSRSFCSGIQLDSIQLTLRP